MAVQTFDRRLVIHARDRTRVDVWIGQRASAFSKDVRLYIDNRAIAEDLSAEWNRLGPAEGDGEATHWQIHTVSGLTAGATHTARLEGSSQSDSTKNISATFRTLPNRLPLADTEQPIVVLLGSCAAFEHDDGRTSVDGGFRAMLHNKPSLKPHLVLLCGDQVYLDQPAGPTGPFGLQFLPDGRSSAWCHRHFTSRYRNAWQGFGNLLNGPVVMLTDDHDFYNDYPNVPNEFAWPALHGSCSFRERYVKAAQDYVAAFQHVHPIRIFSIGRPAEISFCMVDSRIHREVVRDGRSVEKRFIRPSVLNKIKKWTKTLTGPGILVMSQPILTEPAHVKKVATYKSTTDYNLPAFKEQYEELINSLMAAPHDVCVLSGDVHYGRIARVAHHLAGSTPDGDSRSHHLVEVISSPLAALVSAPGVEKGSPRRLSSLRIFYGPYTPRRTDGGRINHFMTLEFARTNSSVMMRVSAWPTVKPHQNDRVGGPPPGEPAWVREIHLDVAYAPQPPVSEVRKVTRLHIHQGRVIGLCNPDEAWNYRHVHDAIAEIRRGIASYTTGFDSPLNTLHVVDGDGDAWLRTSPSSPVNLKSLPPL